MDPEARTVDRVVVSPEAHRFTTSPMPRETPMAAETAWASLGGDLLLAKNSDGLVYWPDLGINQIGSLQPGQGYQIYMNAESTLSYPVSGP